MSAYDKRPIFCALAVINAYQRATGKGKKRMSVEMGHSPNYVHTLCREGVISRGNMDKLYAFCAATWPEGILMPSPLRMFAEAHPQAVASVTVKVQARPEGNRDCLCCGRPFHSEGIHNRMCDPCRASAGSAMVI